LTFTFAKLSEISANKLLRGFTCVSSSVLFTAVNKSVSHHATKEIFCQKKQKKKKHAELSRISQHVDSECKLGEKTFSRHFQSGFSKKVFNPLQIAVKKP